MKSYRHEVFETNSSSQHTLTMCSEEVYNDFKEGHALFDYDLNNVVAISQIYQEFVKESGNRLAIGYDAFDAIVNNDTEFANFNAMGHQYDIQPTSVKTSGLDRNATRNDYIEVYDWLRKYSYIRYDEWSRCSYGEKLYCETKVIDGVSVVAFGKHWVF